MFCKENLQPGDRIFHPVHQKYCEIVEVLDGQLPLLLKYQTDRAWYAFTANYGELTVVNEAKHISTGEES